MSLSLRWISNDDNPSDLEQISLVRVRAYSGVAKDFAEYHKSLLNDRRPGEHLLAEQDGRAVGSTTSLSMHMWVRAARLTCQGVASVGTIRTARRTLRGDGSNGVASQLMTETVRRAREREMMVTALMPFRASFYEHFGYGIVERRAEWAIPSGALRSGACDGLRYVEQTDQSAIESLRQRQVERGRCDIETTSGAWERRREFHENGFEIIDRPSAQSEARGWMVMQNVEHENQRYLNVSHHAHDSADALVRQLQFLASQRDQFAGVLISTPADLPVNYLLRESQVPHRRVEHAAATCKLITRMQVRVLDHVKFFEKQTLPPSASHAKGSVVVSVRETEGSTSTFQLDFDGAGHVRATASNASPDISAPDTAWSSIACGELSASAAMQLGLIEARSEAAALLLDALHAGPAPYSNEYF